MIRQATSPSPETDQLKRKKITAQSESWRAPTAVVTSEEGHLQEEEAARGDARRGPRTSLWDSCQVRHLNTLH